MPFIQQTCPICNKRAISEYELTIGETKVYRLKCGHVLTRKSAGHRDYNNIVSLDGKHPFEYQKKFPDFAADAGFRCLNADEMGIGKTIQFLITAKSFPEEVLPFLVICKSGLKTQWQYEIMRWLGEDFIAQSIDGGRDILLPGLKGYIVSLDLLRRFNGNFIEQIKKARIKTICIDECQLIKNPQSQRTVEVRNICKEVPNVIALSGTPIKNNAGEYFSILNILRPEIFSNYQRFLDQWVDTYYDGFKLKIGGIRSYMVDEFKERTKDFIIRRTRAEVLPDLPKVNRQWHFIDLGKTVREMYQKRLALFAREMDQEMTGFERANTAKKGLESLRQIAGLAKIDPIIDLTMEFLGSTDRKRVIFVHHIDVAKTLQRKLGSLMLEIGLKEPEYLAGSIGDRAGEMIQRFKEDDKRRILIASTLAAGEGHNIQFCSDCDIMERQWNPANEEQAEGRFVRVGQEADRVDARYIIAVGTVDEDFTKLVEQKREVVTKTMGHEACRWDETSLILELTQIALSKGLRV